MTKAEQVFIERMAYYVSEGFTFDEAAKKVIEADSKIFNFIFSGNKQGESAKKVLCVQTYYDVKANETVNNIFKDNTSDLVAEEIRQAVLSN